MKQIKFLSFAVMACMLLIYCDTTTPAESLTKNAVLEPAEPITVATFKEYSAGDVSFAMISVIGGLTFPFRMVDYQTTTVENAYEISETEVTYLLWWKVYQWAIDNSIDHDGNGIAGDDTYSFENKGRQGGDTYGPYPVAIITNPVTTTTWFDVMVWTNALTEYYNFHNNTSLTCVYTSNGTVIRNSDRTNSQHSNETIVMSNDGFRLLTYEEWELAARYRGADSTNSVQKTINGIDFSNPSNGIYWTVWNSVSGANNNSIDEVDDLAWYSANSGYSSCAVKYRKANALGLYDMSGNVSEWTLTGDLTGYRIPGGDWWSSSISEIAVASVVRTSVVNLSPATGFRLGRTVK